jgi:hypothetical protein
MDAAIAGLASLFKETGHAHHQAYIETDGADPDWAIWYADYLVDKLPEHLGGAKLQKSEIIYLLMRFSFEQTLDAPGAEWTRYYAKILLQRYT